MRRSPTFLVLLGLLFLLPKVAVSARYIMEDPEGRVVAEKGSEVLSVPASTLKILTSLVALDTLGPEYRMETSWGVDPRGNLVIVGGGDPLLVSEALEAATRKVAKSLPDQPFSGIVVDASLFAEAPEIPSVRKVSIQPYDAPIDAFVVNFSTVSFRKEKGRVVSAEPETPLLPEAVPAIRASTLSSGRIPIPAGKTDAHIRHAAALARYFLEEAGVRFETGNIRISRAPVEAKHLVTTTSPFTTKDAVEKLLRHSNNFCANLLLLASGRKAYPEMDPLAAGIRLMEEKAEALGIRNAAFVEGSGISRRNRISPEGLLKAVKAFFPYRTLLRDGRFDLFKTGTLDGIRTRAGFMKGKGGLFPYVLFENKRPEALVPTLRTLRQVADTPF